MFTSCAWICRRRPIYLPNLQDFSTLVLWRCISPNRVDQIKIESRALYTLQILPGRLNFSDREIARRHRGYTCVIDVMDGAVYLSRGAGFAYMRTFLKLARSLFSPGGASLSLSSLVLHS